MASSKYNTVWNLLSEYDFIVDANSCHEDLKCVICNNLIRDACVSSSCSCSFCYKCFNTYIHDGSQYCPGGKVDCKEVKLVFGVNVVKSDALNKKISKLKVKCPNQSCECYVELIEMEEHQTTCSKQVMECPYFAIGCNIGQINKGILSSHLQTGSLNHTELLIDSIKGLKNDSTEGKLEMAYLKKEYIDKENGINAFEDHLNKVRNELELRMKVEIDKITDKLNEQRLEIDALKKERITVSEAEEVKEDFCKVIEKRKKDEEKQKRIFQFNEISSNVEVDFLWRIEHVSKKIGRNMYSECFGIGKYKLSLYTHIDKNSTDIWLYCYIMKGENDHKVQWPMIGTMTLSIIDQDTLKYHESKTVDVAYDRPSSDYAERVGTHEFMKYSAIKENKSIIADDSMIVSCLFTEQ